MSETFLRISEFIHKERVGEITIREKAELDQWLNEDNSHRLLYEQLTAGGEWLEEYDRYKQISGEEAWRNIEKQIRQRGHRSVFRWIAGAAAAVVLLVVGLPFFYNDGRDEVIQPVAQTLSYDSIRPGGQKAILQLANGQKITLQNTEMQLKTEVAAIHQSEEYLKYEADSCPSVEKMNSLTVPQGGEFKVILSDGTKVWLNAKSRLEYPEVFVGDCRQVKLEGEAYFEVERDEEKPFVVELQGAAIKVLGTSFNVKAFSEERRTIATLLKGSVEMSVSGQKVVLMPDQQASYVHEENSLKVKEVEAMDFIAWKEGKFVFRNEPLEYMMETIARWYNIRVFYQNPEVKTILFSGKMDRYGSVEEVLKMIEQTGKVHFQLVDKGLIIRSK